MASPGGPVGSTPVRDVATLSGGFNPGGNVPFRLFSNNARTTQLFSSTNPLPAASDLFTPAAAGTYCWTAVYNGDANNNTATSACNAPNESVVIAAFEPPPFTVTVTGDFLGPLTVNSGDSLQLLNPGGGAGHGQPGGP